MLFVHHACGPLPTVRKVPEKLLRQVLLLGIEGCHQVQVVSVDGLGWLINIGNTPKDTTKVCDAKRTSLVMSIHCQCFPNRTSQSSGMGSRLDSPGLSLECYFLNLFEAFGDSRCLPKEVILGCFARIFGCPGPSLAERRLASGDGLKTLTEVVAVDCHLRCSPQALQY